MPPTTIEKNVFPRKRSVIPLDKELQRVNVKQKPFRQIQAHSGIIKLFKTLCKPGIFRAVVYPEP